jgi:hypothetical protein
MEVCWFTPLLLAVTRSTWVYPPFLVALVLWLLVWAMMRLAHLLSERQITFPVYEAIVVATVVLSSLLAIRLYVYRGAAWYDVRWLAETARSLSRVVDGVSDEVILLGTMFFLWWRAIGLSQREFTFHAVGYEFRRNVLLLVVATLTLSFFVGSEVNVFVAPFFFFSLLAVALARVKDKSQVSGGIARPFGLRWLVILSLSGLLVLTLAALLGNIYSLEGWKKLLGWMDPLFDWLGRAAGWLLVKLLQFLSPIIDWLVETIRRLLAARGLEPTSGAGLDDFLEQIRDDAGDYGGPPAWVALLGRYICPAMTILFALVLIVLWLERRRRWQLQVVGDESQSLWDEDREDAGADGLLRRGWQRIRDMAGKLADLPVSRRLYAAISVRYIYANVIRLAERRGFPRPLACTPNEFVTTLERAFPGHGADVAHLTAAYVKVHYGEVPANRSELVSLRESWERLRSAPGPEHDAGKLHDTLPPQEGEQS